MVRNYNESNEPVLGGIDWDGLDARQVERLHRYDDVDTRDDAHHHTLGSGLYQAAPGSLVARVDALDVVPLPIAKGGTGATTAEDARANLGLETDTANITPGANWSIYSGHDSYLQRIGPMVFLRATVRASSGASVSSLVTIPAGFRPAQQTVCGTVRSSAGLVGDMFVQSNGIVLLVYYAGTLGAGDYLPISAEWRI